MHLQCCNTSIPYSPTLLHLANRKYLLLSIFQWHVTIYIHPLDLFHLAKSQTHTSSFSSVQCSCEKNTSAASSFHLGRCFLLFIISFKDIFLLKKKMYNLIKFNHSLVWLRSIKFPATLPSLLLSFTLVLLGSQFIQYSREEKDNPVLSFQDMYAYVGMGTL